MAKTYIHLPLLVGAAIVLVVIYIVSRADTSPFAKMMQWISGHVEGFSAPVLDTPKCPPGFRFFNDRLGESFCCKGKVNPYTHFCEAKADNEQKVEYRLYDKKLAQLTGMYVYTRDKDSNQCKSMCDEDPNCKLYMLGNYPSFKECALYNDNYGAIISDNVNVQSYVKLTDPTSKVNLCAFKDNVKDPRKHDGTILPQCSAFITSSHKQKQTANCPESLPNYASMGKCCLNDADLDGVNCSTDDNADPKNYCIVSGPVHPGEQSCSGLKLDDSSTCPKGLNKMSYTLGDREKAKYGNATVGVTIPVCFAMDKTCIPNNVIKELQQDGIYADKTNLDGWKYSCSGYERVNVHRDVSAKMDNTYV